MEGRTFVSVVPVATESILDSFFSQNILSMYILSMKQQKNRAKNRLEPSKKAVFSRATRLGSEPNLVVIDWVWTQTSIY